MDMDTSKNGADTHSRAVRWLVGTDTGLSSMTICQYLLTSKVDRHAYPHDPSDLGRCIHLLDLIPEWRGRISEMAALSPEWAALTGAWSELEALYRQEEPSGTAPLTYDRMQELLYPGREAVTAVVEPTPKPLAAKEIEDAIHDPYALGRKERTGKNLYRVKVEMSGRADGRATVNVWATSEEDAQLAAEDWACDNTIATDVDWDVVSSRVQVILNREDPDSLLNDRAYAETRGQTFLV